MSKLPKVFNILTILLSVIGFVIVLIYAMKLQIGSGSWEERIFGMLFGLSLAVIPYIISKSISDLNYLSNLNFSHED